VLSGGFQASTCNVVAPSACAFGDTSIANGDSVTAYEYANVPFGETCQAQERSCTNGTLSGSYAATACTVQPASTCVFGGQTLESGDSVVAYASDEVAFGQTCAAETRTCTNGVLSGSNEQAMCEVQRQDPITFRQQDFVASSVEYGCWEENFLGGSNARVIETFSKWVPRDSNNECPGWLSVKAERTSNHLINHPGIKYKSNKYEGIGHDLASDQATLQALCNLKDYRYVVGQAPRSSNGFRTLTSPENNRLTYGRGSNFATTAVSINQTFNGSKGYVTCSDTAAAVGGSTSGGNTGGENNGGGRDVNLSPNETR